MQIYNSKNLEHYALINFINQNIQNNILYYNDGGIFYEEK